ncbi:MAG: FecR domain-containing protein [Pseudomonadota bacterium]
MRALAVLGLCLLPLVSFAQAGTVTLLTGKATATSTDGTVRDLSKGSGVNSGEIVSSGAGSYINLKFRDGGLILLRPNTRFQIEQYSYEAKSTPKAPATASGRTTSSDLARAPAPRTRAFFRLLKGGLRTVTGLIGKANRNDYRLATPTATIGIRGTEVFTFTCNVGCSKDPAVLAALKDILGDENFSFDKSDIIGTLDGETDVTNNETGEKTNLTKGKFVVSTTTDDGNVPLDDPNAAMGGGGDLLKLDPKNCQ